MKLHTSTLTLILVTSPALAQQIPDRATLDAILGPHQVLNDFETYQVAAGAQDDTGVNLLQESSVVNGQGPGLVGSTVRFNDLTGNSFVWQGENYAGIPSQTLSVTNTQGAIWIDHTPTVNAVGFDIMSEQGNPFIGEVVFFACPGGTVGTVQVDMSTGGAEKVFVGWESPVGICQIEIYETAPSGPPSLEDYGYGILPPLFDRYCTSSFNSTGQFGMMYADGSASIADNDLTLRAEGLPVGFGVFVFGVAPEQTAFGNGFRCVMPAVTYLWGPRRTGGGVLQRDVDLAAYGFQPGTYYFQCWYRDRIAMPAGFNATDGISIQLFP